MAFNLAAFELEPSSDLATATLTIPPQAEQVRTARLVTTAAARRCGVSEDRIDEIRLAVGEVIARSVLRQQRAGLPDPVVVDITDDDELFTVRVQEATAPDFTDEDGSDNALDSMGQILETPFFEVEMQERCERLMSILSEKDQIIAQKRLEGYTEEEIADLIGMSRRSVQLHIKAIREAWSRMLEE